MIINANNTIYEILKIVKARTVQQYGLKAFEEQQQKLQQFIANNTQLIILATHESYMICQEIEEANYREITDNKLLEKKDEK